MLFLYCSLLCKHFKIHRAISSVDSKCIFWTGNKNIYIEESVSQKPYIIWIQDLNKQLKQTSAKAKWMYHLSFARKNSGSVFAKHCFDIMALWKFLHSKADRFKIHKTPSKTPEIHKIHEMQKNYAFYTFILLFIFYERAEIQRNYKNFLPCLYNNISIIKRIKLIAVQTARIENGSCKSTMLRLLKFSRGMYFLLKELWKYKSSTSLSIKPAASILNSNELILS